MSQNKPRTHSIDAVEDLWTIFECPECGILFFGEERLQSHLKSEHGLPMYTKYFSVELIRAIPQDEKT